MKFIDLHCDTLSRLLSKGGELAASELQVDIDKLERGDCEAQFFAIFMPVARVEEPYKRCIEMLELGAREFEKNADRISLCRSYDDLVAARNAGKVGAFLTIEDSGIFECDIDKLHEVYDRGVRLVTITWNFKNAAGSPNNTPEFSEEGLTAHGIEMVAEMERLGVIPDASHLSDGGFWSLVEHCKKPFVCSHSNARSVASVTRNLTDDMLKALGECGGVTGLNFCDYFVRPRSGDMFTRPQEGEDMSCTLDDLAAHAAHIVRFAGEDACALGSDFDGIGGWPKGLDDASHMPLISDALYRKGLTERQIEKIFHLNAERIIHDCLN